MFRVPRAQNTKLFFADGEQIRRQPPYLAFQSYIANNLAIPGNSRCSTTIALARTLSAIPAGAPARVCPSDSCSSWPRPSPVAGLAREQRIVCRTKKETVMKAA